MPAFVCPAPLHRRGVHPLSSRARAQPRHRDARRARRTPARARADEADGAPPAPALIVGLNQYSHDASVAVIDATTGALLFAQSKERLTRRKHDGGVAGLLVRHALSHIARRHSGLNDARAAAQCVRVVVANNHHFRILPHELGLRVRIGLGYAPHAALSPWNQLGHAVPGALAPRARKVELSHHFAHALAAVRDAPFDRGLVVVMDGMGDSLDEWVRARGERGGGAFHTELCGVEAVCTDGANFAQFPADVMTRPGVTFREAETVYVFEKGGERCTDVRFSRVFKRWTPENAPSELANHSFEDMESVGAMYSRVSAIIFKDWNNCGKVMGLAPYGKPSHEPASYRRFLEGSLLDGSLSVSRGQGEGLHHISQSFKDAAESPKLRAYYEQLAFDMQKDLEAVVSDFVSGLVTQTGEDNVVFTGGVALNSTMNGILSAHPQVRNLYVPPFPGDEGISIGCAQFGLHLYSAHDASATHAPKPEAAASPMPYLGREYDAQDVDEALACFAPWITVEPCDVVDTVARALADSAVVAWFSGRSEFGPRALGHRSLLADPRNRATADFLNGTVKRRESFRPFAPAVLVEHAADWFEGCERGDVSPFMSVTRRSKRAAEIAAVTHVDGTARLQTVCRENDPVFHGLIEAFHRITDVPMLLNTSFNTAGEPIVESPYDALQTFLNASGIDMLAFPGRVVRRREAPRLRGAHTVESACAEFRSEQLQDSGGASVRVRVWYIPALGNRSEYLAEEGADEDDDDSEGGDQDEGICVDLVDSLQLEILELVHESGPTTVADVLGEFATRDEGGDEGEGLPYEDDLLERITDLYRNRLIMSE